MYACAYRHTQCELFPQNYAFDNKVHDLDWRVMLATPPYSPEQTVDDPRMMYIILIIWWK